MNCAQTIRFSCAGNEFLRTTYSPNQGGEQFVNKSKHPLTKALSGVVAENYSQRPAVKVGVGEQLLPEAKPPAGEGETGESR